MILGLVPGDDWCERAKQDLVFGSDVFRFSVFRGAGFNQLLRHSKNFLHLGIFKRMAKLRMY